MSTSTPIHRRPTKKIHVGSVAIGGDAPISVQSMTNTDTCDVAATVAQIQRCVEAGLDITHVYDTEEMVGGDDVFFAATGASTGELLRGVQFTPGGATTQSLVMRSRSGTIRWIDSQHDFQRLDKVRYQA